VARDGEAGWRVRPLAQIYGSGYVRTSILRLAKGDRGRGSFAQGEPGMLHHVYAVEHLFERLTATTTLYIVTTVPQVPQFGPLAATVDHE
jgi:hypothetical protein